MDLHCYETLDLVEMLKQKDKMKRDNSKNKNNWSTKCSDMQNDLDFSQGSILSILFSQENELSAKFPYKTADAGCRMASFD